MTIRDDLAGPSMRKARRSRRGAGRTCKAKHPKKFHVEGHHSTCPVFQVQDDPRRSGRAFNPKLDAFSSRFRVRTKPPNSWVEHQEAPSRAGFPARPRPPERTPLHTRRTHSTFGTPSGPGRPHGQARHPTRLRRQFQDDPRGFCLVDWTRNRNRKVFGEDMSPEPRTRSTPTQAHVEDERGQDSSP